MIRPYLDAAMREREEGRRELLEHVLSLSARELDALPKEQILRLGPDALRDALRRRQHEPTRTAASYKPRTQEAVENVTRDDVISPWRRRWLLTDPALRATAVGVYRGLFTAFTVGLVVWVVPIAAARVTTSAAPGSPAPHLCERLTGATNGCYYRVTSGISWDDAAGYLGMDVSSLLNDNPNLSTIAVVPAGKFIAVRGTPYPYSPIGERN